MYKVRRYLRLFLFYFQIYYIQRYKILIIFSYIINKMQQKYLYIVVVVNVVPKVVVSCISIRKCKMLF